MSTPLDRRSIVGRHTIELTAPDREHVLTVGNGDFAYTADITGMQTFADFHDPSLAMRLGVVAVNTTTMSSWGWHEMPNPEGYVLDDAMSTYDTRRGPVRYPDRYDMESAMRGELAEEDRAGAWLHVNPQRLDLGRIGLELRATPDDAPERDPLALQEVTQTLDLWSGIVRSSFVYAGEQVTVETAAAPDSATVTFRIRSALLRDGRAAVVLRFPYASDGFFQTDDWNADDRHRSELAQVSAGRAVIERVLDGTRYEVELAYGAADIGPSGAPHTFSVTTSGDVLELVVTFSPDGTERAEDVTTHAQVVSASAGAWEAFWMSGAALDLAGSTDPRARELERRVVLSQYLTRVNCAGSLPPAETGLITNSWQGKFHLEMHFWHAAHFAAWGRPELLERSLGWYLSTLDEARAVAARQGYPGARWPKHVGPDGRESPSPIGALLIWQQPHILYLLELVWNASPEERRPALLARFSTLVEETATFMSAFPEARDGAFHLGPPVMPAQEFYDARTTEDPTFELAYWHWGLEIAQRWRQRGGRPRHEGWDEVQQGLAHPKVVGGRYVAVNTDAEMRRDDHPSLLAALGMLPPTPLIEVDVMSRTLRGVLDDWRWDTAWGWDFPVLAMTATRLDDPQTAVDALLMNELKNRHTVVGHNPQMGGILPLYLPGNGALLAAVSLMAAKEQTGTSAGFPADGWAVKAEGFVPWP